MNTITEIRIARCSIVEGSRLLAVVHLNESFEHSVGQPVMVRYTKDDGSFDTITAIGIKNGKGPDCYSIISTGGITYVAGIYEELPDVSSLVHNIPYIAKYNGEWCLVYIDDDGRTRKMRDLVDGEKFYNLEDGHNYFYNDGTLFRDDSQAALVLDTLELLKLGGLDLSVEVVGGNVLKKGTELNPPKLKVQVLTGITKEDLTQECTYTVLVNGNEEPINGAVVDGIAILTNGINETTTYIVTAEYKLGKGSIKSGNIPITVSFVDPVLYGPEETTYQEALWDGTGELELTMNLNRKKSIIKVPTEFGALGHIYDVHGLDYLVDDYDKTTEGIYTVYTKKDAVVINNFKQILTR